MGGFCVVLFSLEKNGQQWSWQKGGCCLAGGGEHQQAEENSQSFPGSSGKGRKGRKGLERTGRPATSERLPSPTASGVSQVREKERLLPTAVLKAVLRAAGSQKSPMAADKGT